jgi:adenylate cyclase
MSTDARPGADRRVLRVAGPLAASVTIPLALLAILRLFPHLDLFWRNRPAHFWIVLAAAATALVLGFAVMEASRSRRDARLFLISLAFVSGAGFLGLHALATPGVLVGPNLGFEIATSVGLVLAGVFVALSTIELSAGASARIMSRARPVTVALLGVIVLWGAVSVAELPPLHDRVPDESLDGWLVLFALVGVLAYGTGAWGYLRLYRRRPQRFLVAVSAAFGLLAATMVVLVFAASWRISWWTWHVLMLTAFGLIAVAARREWHQERFTALYLMETLDGARDVSILFADLQGFTAFSERRGPQDVKRMLDTYLARLVPAMERSGGEVHQLIGDAVMVVFNKQGDELDHPLLASRAALAFQDVAAEVARDHPDWPRFRVGVNSGEVVAGVLGDRGHRKHDVIGDTVNLAARLESQAPVGEVAIAAGTYERLPEGTVVEELPQLVVKGRSEPVTAYILHALPR